MVTTNRKHEERKVAKVVADRNSALLCQSSSSTERRQASCAFHPSQLYGIPQFVPCVTLLGTNDALQMAPRAEVGWSETG
jgi:hypothetical protein